MEQEKRRSEGEWCSENLQLRRFSNWTGQGPSPWRGQRLFYWILVLWSCFFTLFPPFIILTSTINHRSQSMWSRFPPNIASPSTTSLLVSIRLSRVYPHSSASQSPVSRSCHRCPPETCWISCALLHGPSSRYQGGFSPPWGLGLVNIRLPPVVCRKPHLLFLNPTNAMYSVKIHTKTQQRWNCICRSIASLVHSALLIKMVQSGGDGMKRQI